MQEGLVGVAVLRLWRWEFGGHGEFTPGLQWEVIFSALTLMDTNGIWSTC